MTMGFKTQPPVSPLSLWSLAVSGASTDRAGPRPWFGCDKSSEAWRAYCEAWEWAFLRKDPRLRGMIADCRGEAGVAALRHNVEVVRKDYAGEIDDRTDIARLLQ